MTGTFKRVDFRHSQASTHVHTQGCTHTPHTGTPPPPSALLALRSLSVWEPWPAEWVCQDQVPPTLRLFSGRLPPATRQLPSSPHLLCIPAIGKWRAPLPFTAEPELGHRSLGWTESHGHSY